MTSSSHPCCSSLEERVARLEAALEEIARRTLQADLNRIAHRALGHEEKPLTVRFLAELEREKAARSAGGHTTSPNH